VYVSAKRRARPSAINFCLFSEIPVPSVIANILLSVS
jgi:hypothetical protein